MRTFTVSSLSILLMLATNAHAETAKIYGAAFPAGEALALALSKAIADHASHADKPGRYSGRITEVCQQEGCWMMLEDEGQAARVTMRDHAFAVPKDASGRAEVHGVLSQKHLSPEAVRHMQAESKGGLPVADVEYRIVADGVEIGG